MSDLIKKLSDLLRANKHILTTAESCTGGMIAAAITEHSGSSEIFDRGFVTYSNNAKQDMLAVSEETLTTHGAVSEQCAKEMVKGALDNSSATLAISVTGIAGPGGGTDKKPVGLVYIGYGLKDAEPRVKECHFDGDRQNIRDQACQQAITLLIELISDS